MKKSFVLATALVAGGAWSSAFAQANSCAIGLTQDACQKAVDLYQYVAPQLGTAITGGNATLGQGGALGGLGHFSIGLRVNALAGSIPQVNDASAAPVLTGARATAYKTKDVPIPMPTVDGALGIFKGLPLGLTNVGGIDLLVSASYIPKVDRDEISIDPDSPIKVGYGARVSILQESLVVPGVSVTYLKRDLPVLSLVGTTNSSIGGTTTTSTLTVNDLSEKTTAWRLVASKSLILFGISAGYGQDKYESSADANATISGQTSSKVSVAQTMTRGNMFVDLSFNLPILKIIGEVGQVSGGTAPSTVNTFPSKGIVDSRLYGSVGIRLSW
jgi:hypothetical protein